MVRLAILSVLLGLSLGCAIGEMPQAAPVDGDLDDEEDEDTPLTTGADDAGAPEGEDEGTTGGADDASDPGDDASADDDAASTGAPVDDPAGSDGDDAGSGDRGEDAGSTGATEDTGSDDMGESDGDAGDTGGDDGSLPDAIDVSDYDLVQTEAFRAVTLPGGTVVPPGAYLVIGRDATRVEFEAFWGPLPVDTVYLDGALLHLDTFPTINGDESYELLDPLGAGVDGPSAPLSISGNLQRLDPGEPATLVQSWQSSVDPAGDATPGAGQVDSALFSGIYISEVSDTVGSGNFVYEFVELYHDP